jgi:hypothetical protein
VPVELLPFMPGSVAENKDIPFTRWDDPFRSFIKEDVKRLGITVARLTLR